MSVLCRHSLDEQLCMLPCSLEEVQDSTCFSPMPAAAFDQFYSIWSASAFALATTFAVITWMESMRNKASPAPLF